MSKSEKEHLVVDIAYDRLREEGYRSSAEEAFCEEQEEKERRLLES